MVAPLYRAERPTRLINRGAVSAVSRFNRPLRDIAREVSQVRTNTDAHRSEIPSDITHSHSILLISEVRLVLDMFAELLLAYCNDLSVCSQSQIEMHSPAAEPAPDLVIIHTREQKVGQNWHEERMATIRTAYRRSPVLLLSESKDPDDEDRAIEAGFAGFLPATQSIAQVVAAIRVILAGGRFHMKLAEEQGLGTISSERV